MKLAELAQAREQVTVEQELFNKITVILTTVTDSNQTSSTQWIAVITVHKQLWNNVTHFLDADISQVVFVMCRQKFLNGIVTRCCH